MKCVHVAALLVRASTLLYEQLKLAVDNGIQRWGVAHRSGSQNGHTLRHV